MLELFQTHIIGQWRMIMNAPVPYVMTTIVVALAIWAAHVWAYGRRLEKKDDTIALLDREITDYKRKLDGASPDQAKEKIESLERKVEQFSRFLEPRRLTRQQKTGLANMIRTAGPIQGRVRVVHDMSCTDCDKYAADLAEAIKSAPGWMVEISHMAMSFKKASSGLAVLVRDRSQFAQEAIVLIRALERVEIPFEVFHQPKLAEGFQVELLVVARAWT
jgi:hypothetical protein